MHNLKVLDTMASLASGLPGDGSALSGFFYRGTRHLAAYSWNLGEACLLSEKLLGLSRLSQVYSSTTRHGSDFVIIRTLDLGPASFSDRLEYRNYGRQEKSFSPALEASCDFRDLMGLRLGLGPAPKVEAGPVLAWKAKARDDICLETRLEAAPSPREAQGGQASWVINLAPGQTACLEIRASFSSSEVLPFPPPFPLLNADYFRSRFAELLEGQVPHRAVIERAIADLHGLLHVEGGHLVTVAGLPNFDTPFGRDSLITAGFLLDWLPELAAGTLRLAAELQGRGSDAFNLEEEGKIFHELRRGELSRTRAIAFGRYYGSVDSTPLFVSLLGDYWKKTEDLGFLRELEAPLKKALAWILQGLEKGGGFLRFRADPSQTGLKVQSWKDSRDSLSFPDGKPATGAIAVGQVQAYAYGALEAGAMLSAALEDGVLAKTCSDEAGQLAARIRSRLWLPRLGYYALALDGENRPLEVPASDSGHFLAYSLESEAEAQGLVRLLLSPELFSGWGVRTLASSAGAYNPLSYHNGSVWPHDNAILAMGMAARGFAKEARGLATALLDAVEGLDLARAPELLAGFSRNDIAQPVPHPFTCSPQAWSAAAVLRLAALEKP